MENSITRPLQRPWYHYTRIRVLRTTQHGSPVQPLSMTRANSLLRARGHVGCWAELQPESW